MLSDIFEKSSSPRSHYHLSTVSSKARGRDQPDGRDAVDDELRHASATGVDLSATVGESRSCHEPDTKPTTTGNDL